VTEEQWFACTDSQTMLSFLNGRGGGRRARLFAVACCRGIQHLMSDEKSRQAIEAAEKYAEGMIGERELLDAHDEAAAVYDAAWDARESAWDACNAMGGGDPAAPALDAAADAARAAAAATHRSSHEAARHASGAASWAAGEGEACLRGEQAALLRDLFGPLLFRQVVIDPSWRTPAVRALANSIYGGRDFAALPVLADALEEAGCDDQEILGHLRQQGQDHIRGCWALDRVLGKE
jgi:hypothetical protein